MHKLMLSLMMLAFIFTAGCAEMIEARRTAQQWRDSLGLPSRATPTQQKMQQQQYGEPVYRAEDCIGAVVNGVCHGSTGAAQPRATCYGQMLNGQCTGPMY